MRIECAHCATTMVADVKTIYIPRPGEIVCPPCNEDQKTWEEGDGQGG